MAEKISGARPSFRVALMAQRRYVGFIERNVVLHSTTIRMHGIWAIARLRVVGARVRLYLCITIVMFGSTVVRPESLIH